MIIEKLNISSLSERVRGEFVHGDSGPMCLKRIGNTVYAIMMRRGSFEIFYPFPGKKEPMSTFRKLTDVVEFLENMEVVRVLSEDLDDEILES